MREAQGLRHYRYVTSYDADAIYWKMAIKITVSPDKEPEVVIESERPAEPFYGETIDEFYQYIADEMSKIPRDPIIKIRYNKQYHYPEYYSTSLGGDSGQQHLLFGIEGAKKRR